MNSDNIHELEYNGYKGSVLYHLKEKYYSGEVEIEGVLYSYEGDTMEELREDFEDVIDSLELFDEEGGPEEE
ncbi:hypothetical protein [[Clostridium] aminophilum]|uniref:hypothetical protein n=1 Tax=[Clostridium] aminophilum TaxID=1526 RepID=UPI00332B29D3